MQKQRVLVIGPLYEQVIGCITRKNKTCKVDNSFEVYQNESFSYDFVTFKYHFSQMKQKYPLLNPKCQFCLFIVSCKPPFNLSFSKQVYKYVSDEMPIIIVSLGTGKVDKLEEELAQQFGVQTKVKVLSSVSETSLQKLLQEIKVQDPKAQPNPTPKPSATLNSGSISNPPNPPIQSHGSKTPPPSSSSVISNDSTKGIHQKETNSSNIYTSSSQGAFHGVKLRPIDGSGSKRPPSRPPSGQFSTVHNPNPSAQHNQFNYNNSGSSTSSATSNDSTKGVHQKETNSSSSQGAFHGVKLRPIDGSGSKRPPSRPPSGQFSTVHNPNPSAQQSNQNTGGHNPSSSSAGQFTSGYNPSSSSTGQFTGGYNPSSSSTGQFTSGYNPSSSSTGQFTGGYIPNPSAQQSKQFGYNNSGGSSHPSNSSGTQKSSPQNQSIYNFTTCSITNKENKTIDYVQDPKFFKNALAPSKGKRVIFVTLCGSFQTGKSSTIKKLTGDRSNSIQIGDGIRETTRGAFVYGPYSYNGIRTRYGIDVMSEDLDTYFVDTEGCNGFLTGGNNAEANTFLLSQLIAPYAALSNVLISILKTSTTSQEVDALSTMYGIIESIRQGTGRDVTRLMGVVTNVAGYDPHINFENMQNYVSAMMRERFKKNLDLHEIIPLPQFNINNDIFHQSKQFDDAFYIFAQHLIQQIDESLKTSILDAEAVCKMFEALIKRTKKQNLTEIAEKQWKKERNHQQKEFIQEMLKK